MKIEVILTACIVNFGSAVVQSLNYQTEDHVGNKEVHDEGKLQENFQNLFDSIARNNVQDSGVYREVLKHEVSRQQRAFDAMKKEVRVAKSKKSDRRRRSFYGDSNIFRNSAAMKRETEKKDQGAVTEELYIFPAEIPNGDALQPALDLLLSQQSHQEEMDKIYQRMLKKHPKSPYLAEVVHAISNNKPIINKDIQTLRGYLISGAPDDAIKKQPLDWCTTQSLASRWRQLRAQTEKMRGDKFLSAEIDIMLKVVDSAVREMEVYEKYLENSEGFLEEPVRHATPKGL